MQHAKLLTAIASFISCTLLAGAAHATPNFPSAIQSDLKLANAPDCTLCHVGTPSIGTVKTGFGLAMRARGLKPFDAASLATALAAMEADHVDSDGDCVPDIEELKKGTDPNNPNDNPGACANSDGGVGGVDGGGSEGGVTNPAGPSADPGPRYGCGAQVASSDASPAGAAFALLVVIACGLRRRRAMR